MTSESEDILRIQHGLFIGQSIEICSRRGGYGPEDGDQDTLLTSVLRRLLSLGSDPSLSKVQNDSINEAASEVFAVWSRCQNWENYTVLRRHLTYYQKLVADTLTRNDRAIRCVMLGTALGRSEGCPRCQFEDGGYPETLMNERFWTFESLPETRQLLATLQISEDTLLRTEPLRPYTKSPGFEKKVSGYPPNRWGWGILEWNLRESGALSSTTATSSRDCEEYLFGISFGDDNREKVTRTGESEALNLRPALWRILRALARNAGGRSLADLSKEWRKTPTPATIKKEISNLRVTLGKAKWSLTITPEPDESSVRFRLHPKAEVEMR